MNIVGSAVAPENFKTKYEAAQQAISQLKATGYQVDRQNFGKIYFEENDIRKGAEYADTYEEKAAFLLIPKVLKRGIEIGRHGNHKLRQKATVTFAAPVMLNGIRGNMAVVVNLNSNRYKVHRIILPDGTTFKFSTKKEVKQESYQGVTENSSLADTTSFTSNSRISQTNATVNNNISEESENYSSQEQNIERTNAGLDDSAFSMPENDDEVSYSFEEDVVDKTSSLAERVRLGEISQTEYLNELQQLMDEATEKYGAIPKGENPKVDVTVPKQVSDKRNTRQFVRTVLESGTLS